MVCELFRGRGALAPLRETATVQFIYCETQKYFYKCNVYSFKKNKNKRISFAVEFGMNTFEGKKERNKERKKETKKERKKERGKGCTSSRFNFKPVLNQHPP